MFCRDERGVPCAENRERFLQHLSVIGSRFLPVDGDITLQWLYGTHMMEAKMDVRHAVK